VALVETVDDATVRHRSDVRLLMLPLLRRKLGTTADDIDRAAADYWSGQPGPAARAEQIYHLLWLGKFEDLDASWMPAAAQFLEDALDEFASLRPNSYCHIWLARKLERELPAEVRKTASQVTWEWDTRRKARTLIASGRFSEAISVIRERPAEQRTPASDLWLIEVEALLLQGHTAEAGEVASAAIQRMLGKVDEPGFLHSLLTHKTVIEERLDHDQPAIGWARQAAALAEDMKNPVRIFGSTLTLARLLGNAGGQGRKERASLDSRLSDLLANDQVQKALAERPTMLREAAVEIGEDHPKLLASAIEGLTSWSTRSFRIHVPDSIAKLTRPGTESLEALKPFERRLADLIVSPDADEHVKKAIADAFADFVGETDRQSEEE
jgi:hypothetical protein